MSLMPASQQDPGHGDTGGARALDDHARRAVAAAGEPQRVGERGERDDGGAVLVVVEDRDVEAFLEPRLDLEAARGRDVLEVDATEARREAHDGLDDLLDVGGVEADRHRVDAAELLEEHGLALHHRHRGGRADVAEAQDRGPVGDDADHVGHPRVVLGHRRVGRYRLAHPGHTRGVGQRELVGAVEGDSRDRLHLAADVEVEHGVPRMRVLRSHGRDPCTAQRPDRPRPSRGEGHSRSRTTADHVHVRHRSAVARVDALRRVVAEQPPPGRSRACRTPLDGPFDPHRAIPEPGHHQVAGTHGAPCRTSNRSPSRRVGSIERPVTRAMPMRPPLGAGPR